jgi:TonB family protein
LSSRAPSKLIVPSAVVMALALSFSLGAHVWTYVGLGELRAMLARAASDSVPSSEIEIVLAEPPESPSPHDDLVPEPTLEQVQPEPAPEHHERPRHAREHPPEHRPPTPPHTAEPTPPQPAPQPEPQPAAPQPPPQAAPPPDQRAAVDQHSQNPDQPNPDAQYIAEEDNTVEEETVAQITSATHDDATPSPGPPQDDAVQADAPGDSADQVVADMRDTDGSDERRPTPDEAERRDPDDATSDPSHSLHPQAAAQGTDAASDDEQHVESGTPSLGDESGQRALGGQPMQEVLISDGFGSYTVLVPTPGTSGDGGGSVGGHRREGSGTGTSGHGMYAGHVGREGGSPREHGEGEREGPQLGVTYTQLEAVYGEEELERERHARLERRRSHARGSSADAVWDRFRAAMENYIAEVRPGNQTALNAAASPFAHFLHDMHVRIHQQYVEHYLASLSMNPDDPLNDMNMHATLEIAVNPDGSIYRVGIIQTSGQTLFDLGAFTAVWRAQPFPRPPSIILSGDGHAWLHWRFDRGPRQCGTWNAEPFLLDNGEAPPQTTTDAVSDDDLPDEPSGGSPIEMIPAAPVVPSGQ